MEGKSVDEKTVLEELTYQVDEFKQERAKHEKEWQEVCTFLGSRVFDWKGESDEKRPERYTGRPTEYLNKLVSGIMGYTTSPNVTWLKLSLTDDDLADYHGVKDWLEKTEKALYAEFNRESFYAEIPLFIQNAALFGHAVMLIDEKKESALRFLTVSEPQIYLSQNEYNEVDTVFRIFTMTLKDIVSRFPDASIPDTMKKEAEEAKTKRKKVTVLHAVLPRDDYDDEKADDKNMAFASYYVDLDNNILLEESGYHELPYAVFIWDRIADSAYGDSPARQSLPDVKYLNMVEESRGRLAQLSAEPPMNVPDSMRGFESVVPAGFNYYDQPDEIMSPINIGANYPITLDTIKDIESRIRDKFHVDFMLSLQAQGGAKTATEIIELQGEKAALLSSLIVNQNKSLAEIVKRTFNIMYRQDRIPAIPDILVESKAGIKVDFIGPLAQAQKKYHQAGGVQMGLAMAQPIIQMCPSSLDYIDGDALLKNVLDANGFPQNAIRETDEVLKMRQQRAEAEQQAMQQQMQMQEGQALMQNADKLSKTVEQGSVLHELSEQLQSGIPQGEAE